MGVTGEFEGSPVRVGIPIADLATALFATIGVLSALIQRGRTSRGSDIHLSMLHVTKFLHHMTRPCISSTDLPVAGRYGTAHAYSVPWQAFECADGWVVVAVREEKFWLNLTRAVELPKLRHDPRFGSNLERVRNRSVLVAILAARMRERTVAEWLDTFSPKWCPAPVLSIVRCRARP